MRILLICKWVAGATKGDFYYPGSWRDTFELACALSDLGQEIHILTPKVQQKHQKRFALEFTKVLTQKNIIHHFANTNLTFGTSYSPFRLKMLFEEIALIYKIRPDIIQYMQFGPSAIYPFAKKIPVVFYSCDLFKPYPQEDLDRKFIIENWGDRYQKYNPWVILQNLIFIMLIKLLRSDTPKDALAKGAFFVLMHPRGYKNFKSQYRSPNIFLIEKGVFLNTFKPLRKKRQSLIILFIGSILYRKGVFDLIEAAKIVGRIYPKLILQIAGSGPSQAINDLKKTLKKTKIKSQYFGPNPYPRRWQLYHKADIFCLPSYQDAYPSVILEAMAAGLPVVTSQQIDTPIVNNHSGILVSSGDIFGLASALKKLVSNPELRSKISLNAQKTTLNLNWQNQAEKFISLYSKLQKSKITKSPPI